MAAILKRYYSKYRKLPRQFKLGRWHDRDVQDEHEWMRRNVGRFRMAGIVYAVQYETLKGVVSVIPDEVLTTAVQHAEQIGNDFKNGKLSIDWRDWENGKRGVPRLVKNRRGLEDDRQV